MKTVAEMRESAKERVDDFTDTSKKAAYAVMGAPVVAKRHLSKYAGKMGKGFQKELETWITEGERLSGELREGKVVTEIKERVDIDQLQGRVEKLKDQLEDVLTNWRDTFKPGESDETAPKATKTAAKKTAAKKPAAKKSAKAATEADKAEGDDA